MCLRSVLAVSSSLDRISLLDSLGAFRHPYVPFSSLATCSRYFSGVTILLLDSPVDSRADSLTDSLAGFSCSTHSLDLLAGFAHWILMDLLQILTGFACWIYSGFTLWNYSGFTQDSLTLFSRSIQSLRSFKMFLVYYFSGISATLCPFVYLVHTDFMGLIDIFHSQRNLAFVKK